jgi:hypothetical protein
MRFFIDEFLRGLLQGAATSFTFRKLESTPSEETILDNIGVTEWDPQDYPNKVYRITHNSLDVE